MAPTPPREPSWPQFDLRIEDLSHPGVSIFLASVQPLAALREAVIASFKWLYTPQTAPTNVKSMVLILRSMPGVAYTTGDAQNKEIYFSLDYIEQSASRAHDEILGVLVHEVVHCYQYDAKGTCPGGLIEGVADYVRLHAGLAPPHWRRRGGGRWDAGYDTTGYFLDWLEERYHGEIVKQINAAMKDVEYDELIFKTATGHPVEELWEFYCAQLKDKITQDIEDADSSQSSLVIPESNSD